MKEFLKTSLKQFGIGCLGGTVGAALFKGVETLVGAIKDKKLANSIESYSETPSDENTQPED